MFDANASFGRPMEAGRGRAFGTNALYARSKAVLGNACCRVLPVDDTLPCGHGRCLLLLCLRGTKSLCHRSDRKSMDFSGKSKKRDRRGEHWSPVFLLAAFLHSGEQWSPLQQRLSFDQKLALGLISRQARSPRARPWMSISAVATLVATGMQFWSQERSRSLIWASF